MGGGKLAEKKSQRVRRKPEVGGSKSNVQIAAATKPDKSTHTHSEKTGWKSRSRKSVSLGGVFARSAAPRSANQRRPESHDLSPPLNNLVSLQFAPSPNPPSSTLAFRQLVWILSCNGIVTAVGETGRVPSTFSCFAAFCSASRGFDRKLLFVGVPGSDAVWSSSAWVPVASAKAMGPECGVLGGQGQQILFAG